MPENAAIRPPASIHSPLMVPQSEAKDGGASVLGVGRAKEGGASVLGVGRAASSEGHLCSGVRRRAGMNPWSQACIADPSKVSKISRSCSFGMTDRNRSREAMFAPFLKRVGSRWSLCFVKISTKPRGVAANNAGARAQGTDFARASATAYPAIAHMAFTMNVPERVRSDCRWRLRRRYLRWQRVP